MIDRHRKRVLVFFIVVLFLLAKSALATEKDSTAFHLRPKFFTHLSAGAQSYSWLTEERDYFRFKSNSLSFYKASAVWGLNGIEIFSFETERPFAGFPEQNEMLADSRCNQWGVRRYTFGISVEPLIDWILRDEDTWLSTFLIFRSTASFRL